MQCGVLEEGGCLIKLATFSLIEEGAQLLLTPPWRREVPSDLELFGVKSSENAMGQELVA